MSVVKGKRTEGKLEVLVALRNLCVHTINVCKREKNFPKRDRWILANPIVKHAVDAYSYARKANSIMVKTEDDFVRRRGYQVECHASLEALQSLLEIAYIESNMDGQSVDFWIGLVMDCEKKLAGWRTSDRKRYNETK